MKKNILLGIVSFIIFTAMAIYITYPLIFHMTDYVTGELVVAWIMNWNIHAITHFIWPFFNANIFYPFTNTLAYSDLFLSSSVLALPFFVFIHEPELPSNITFISSLILLGFFSYILVYYLTKNFFASLISGMLIVFSPVTLDKRYHLQILALEWIPLALVFFLHFIRTKKYKFLIWSLIFFLVQVYNSFMAGYFLVFSYIGISASYFFFDRNSIKKLLCWKTAIYFIIAFFLILPIALPYYQVSHEFNFVRDIRETIHLALQPEDLLVTNEVSRLKPVLWFFDAKQYPSSAEIRPGFLGVVFTIFSLLAILYVVFLLKKHTRCVKINHVGCKVVFPVAFMGIGLWGLILSFGPALHIGRHTIHHPFLIPLPYAIAYYLFPGWQGIRDSSRFEMLFVVAMGIDIGIFLHELLHKKSPVIQYGIYLLILIGIFGEFVGPIQYPKAYTFETFPPVYNWIAKNTPQNAVILEEPVYNWDNNPFGDNREVLREYFSTLHFRPLISGGSGFSPPSWQKFAIYQFGHFPDNNSIVQLQKYGADYVVVHKDEFDILKKNGDTVIQVLSQNSHLRFIIKLDNVYVYKVI